MSRPAAIPLNAGMKIARWTLIHQAGCGRDNRMRWYCKCDCGTERLVKPQHLRSGTSRSCGCLHRELTGNANRTHGESHPSSPEYRAWASAINRCHQSTDPKDVAGYQNRGVVVCQRWRDSFQAFLDDMGRKPSPRHSLDRYPDNDGNYEPGNCRWATAKEQRANQRRRISTKTKLAAALLALGHIEYEHSKQMSADQIISLYHFDHGILHAINPINEPWNLTPRLISVHREKSRKDTGIVAKTKRLEKAQAEHKRFMDAAAQVSDALARWANEKRAKSKYRWAKRKIQNRPWPKTRWPLRGKP